MKMMLVSDSSELKPHLERMFNFQQVEVIHYDNPIKAMDNLDEISPDIVLFSAADYPRHWKPFVIFLRNTFGRHEAIFMLLINERFDPEEASKAEYLQVNAVLDEDLASQRTAERIRGIVTRYHQNTDIRRAVRYIPSSSDRIAVAFTNPNTFQIMPGTVVDISTGGLRFSPEDPSTLQSLDDHTAVSMASLRLGDSILSISLRVIRITETVAFEYLDLSVDVEQTITTYLTDLAAQELNPAAEPIISTLTE
ncbi:MAG TPA: PilZ domain-containing protein [Alkalispirochaeta sp.]|nr:PilZ domain-containing protein [Alkalispirochaeta sp.]